MLSAFRNFFKSKVGIVVTLSFLGLIAFAFASSDVSNSGTFGGVAGGDRIAVVGEDKIGSAELIRSTNSALDKVRQNNPTASMQAFIGQGALDQVLDQVIDRYAIGGFAKKYGLRAGDNLINSEIIAIPAFRGTDGNFSEESYRQLLASQGLTDSLVRQDFGDGLLAKQILVPTAFGAVIPDKIVSRYAALLKEQRKGAIAVVPSAVFAPKEDPTQEQLQEYYTANRTNYIRPERRIIRYATFGGDVIGDVEKPTENEIAARYAKDSAQYVASETRTLSQLIVPTQPAAKAIRDRVQAGGSLKTAAREAGLEIAKLGPVTLDEVSAQTSAGVAQAAFAADKNTVAEPARSGLGWHVIRVDAVKKIAERSLSQVSPEITAVLGQEKRRAALDDLTASIEERLESGEALLDVASELKLEIKTTKPVIANGTVYASPNEAAPQIIAPIVPTVFQMEEGEPQLAEIVRGEAFLIFEAGTITPSAAAPLKDIRGDVMLAWRRTEGAKAARDATDRILKRMADGSTLKKAMAEEEKTLPGVDSISLSREQLAAAGGKVPPPLALLFSMAKGTTKKLEAPSSGGWFIVDLDEITAGSIAADDPVFQAAKQELGSTTGREYADQLRVAMRDELGVERNATALEAVRKQLSGER